MMQAVYRQLDRHVPTRASAPVARRRARQAGLVAMAALIAIMGAMPAHAAKVKPPVVPAPPAPPAPPALGAPLTTGALYASGVASPGGAVWMGTHLWVSDALAGFCRVNPATAAIEPLTCNRAAISPGQPAYDAATQSVYVPDSSAKGQGVWRLSFDPGAETVGSPVLLAPGLGLGPQRPAVATLGPDGSLYVGLKLIGDVKRIANPSGASQTVETVGRTSDGRGVNGLAFAGPDLYLAERLGVSKITAAAGCNGTCVASQTGIPAANPAALASDGLGVLYIANSPIPARAAAAFPTDVLRYRVSTNTLELYANTAVLTRDPAGAPKQTTPLIGVSALALDGAGKLFVADDPNPRVRIGGIGTGHIWSVAAP